MRLQFWLPKVCVCVIAGMAAGCPGGVLSLPPSEDIAREWVELTLDALEQDSRMPTVEARTLWQLSAVMYESWAAYDPTATGYFSGNEHDQPLSQRTMWNRAETLSHAAYKLLSNRFAQLGQAPPGTDARRAYDAFRLKMVRHGYIDIHGNPIPSQAQALGSLFGDMVLAYAASDGANEGAGYTDTSGYAPVNPPLIVEQGGTNGMQFANAWQELMVGGVQQDYLTPHWGFVMPFALEPYQAKSLRIDPGPPPLFGEPSEPEFIDEMMDCLRFVASMDPASDPGATMMNISPGARGQIADGDWSGPGYAMNPYTQTPYADALVPEGDYLRAVSVYLDGPRFTTPAPWWNELACDVLEGRGTVSRRPANKPRARDLGYDVKLFFALNGALHDAAIAVWDIKRAYVSCRPITGIRYLAELGRLPLEAGLVEVILPGDPLEGANRENIGKLKVKGWAGPDQGVQWMLGVDWVPYQPTDFVTPPFPGYTSGHTAFARAFAEVMTAYTGDPFFPGGLYELQITGLRFESDMTGPMSLQAATYRDLACDAGLARVYCGVHIAADIFASQTVGQQVGQNAYAKALEYFNGQAPAN